jgi:hypothetical protein
MSRESTEPKARNARAANVAPFPLTPDSVHKLAVQAAERR